MNIARIRVTLVAIVVLIICAAVLQGIRTRIRPPQQEPVASAAASSQLEPSAVPNIRSYESLYEYPYPAMWTSGGVTYSIVGATIGPVTVPRDAQIGDSPVNRNLIDPATRQPLQVGSSVYALRLFVKPNTQEYNESYDPYADMQRIVNEEGDAIPPSFQGIASTLGPTRMIDDVPAREVWFLVRDGEWQFTIGTGQRADTPQTFQVRLHPRGSIIIE